MGRRWMKKGNNKGNLQLLRRLRRNTYSNETIPIIKNCACASSFHAKVSFESFFQRLPFAFFLLWLDDALLSLH